jgi:hypothetical protein
MKYPYRVYLRENHYCWELTGIRVHLVQSTSFPLCPSLHSGAFLFVGGSGSLAADPTPFLTQNYTYRK